MKSDIQARGFSLTAALEAAAQHELRAYVKQFPGLHPSLQVRLFDVNAGRGGVDKGCLVSAYVGHGRKVIVASELDSDLYRAIPLAFAKLVRATRAALQRDQTLRRSLRRNAGAAAWDREI